MQRRTDIPVMYDGEETYQLDDGTLAAVVFRRVPAPQAWQICYACDCWEIEASGAPTGIATVRHYHTVPRTMTADLDATLDALCASLTNELLEEKQAVQANATSTRIRNLVVVPTPAIDIPHPLETTPEQLAADLAALPAAAVP